MGGKKPKEKKRPIRSFLVSVFLSWWFENWEFGSEMKRKGDNGSPSQSKRPSGSSSGDS